MADTPKRETTECERAREVYLRATQKEREALREVQNRCVCDSCRTLRNNGAMPPKVR